jgi:hypothetical protein
MALDLSYYSSYKLNFIPTMAITITMIAKYWGNFKCSLKNQVPMRVVNITPTTDIAETNPAGP